jgi:hypothetical protein
MPATDDWTREELIAGAQKAREQAARLRKAADSTDDRTLRRRSRRRAVRLEELAEMLEAQAAKLNR